MNTKRTISFAATLMLIPAGSLLAQATGTANPEPINYTAATNSDATTAPAVSCPAPAKPAATTPTLQPRTPEIVYGAFKPYVPPTHKDAMMSEARQNGPSPVIDGGDACAYAETDSSAYAATDDGAGDDGGAGGDAEGEGGVLAVAVADDRSFIVDA